MTISWEQLAILQNHVGRFTTTTWPVMDRAGGIGPAAPVMAGPVFPQGKRNIPFLQKASNKQSASAILALISLIILSYIIDRKAYQMVQDYWPPTHSVYCYAYKVLCCVKAK